MDSQHSTYYMESARRCDRILEADRQGTAHRATKRSSVIGSLAGGGKDSSFV